MKEDEEMSSKSKFAVLEVMHKLGLAGEEAGLTKADWSNLAQDADALRMLAAWRHDRAKIEIVTHVIDCDAPPFIPNGWRLESHKKGGLYTFDPSKILLHQEQEQKNGGAIKGTELQKWLANKPCLNANVLDYLFAYPELIPESWKTDENGRTRYIYFFGTEYRGSSGRLFVRCLYWNGSRWDWRCDCLELGWCGQDWVAIPAS